MFTACRIVMKDAAGKRSQIGAVRWVNEQTGGLVYREEKVIFITDVEPHGFRRNAAFCSNIVRYDIACLYLGACGNA